MPALQKYEAGNWEAKKPELTRSEASSFALLSADFLWLWNRTKQYGNTGYGVSNPGI